MHGDGVTVSFFVSADVDVLVAEIDDRRSQPHPIRVALSMWREPDVRTDEHVARYQFGENGENGFRSASSSAKPIITVHRRSRWRSLAAKRLSKPSARDPGSSLFPAARGKVRIYISSAGTWLEDADVGFPSWRGPSIRSSECPFENFGEATQRGGGIFGPAVS